VTCKNVWTSREGVEYAWFNNVETKPGVGYPKEWENQEKWNGGWEAKSQRQNRAQTRRALAYFVQYFRQSRACRRSTIITSRSRLTTIICKSAGMKTMPTARPRSLVTGERMEKIQWGPNWEEILGTEFEHRRKDYNFKDIEEEMYGAVREHFHDVSPAPVRTLPQPDLCRVLPFGFDLQARRRRHCSGRSG
jgi:nitrate reductase beta subunit